jgi:hypothetical protein
MTWRDFVARVEEQMRAKGIDVEKDMREVQAIDWDRDAFGGPAPDLYVRIDDDGRIHVTED